MIGEENHLIAEENDPVETQHRLVGEKHRVIEERHEVIEGSKPMNGEWVRMTGGRDRTNEAFDGMGVL